MQTVERRVKNAEWERNGPCRRRSFCTLHSAFCNLHSRSAFTLIELMVAVGLMAILLTMIATIFFGATQAFRNTRASIEIHESARAALNALVSDLTASEFTPYGTGLRGFFGQSGQGPYNTGTVTVVNGSPNVTGTGTAWLSNASPGDVFTGPDGALYGISAVVSDTNLTLAEPYAGAAGPAYTITRGLTFTTLAPQSGARNAAAEAVLQLALVRLALEWDGGSARPPGAQAPRPTYSLMKRVAIPNTSNPSVLLHAFDWTTATTAPQFPPEPIAFHVLSMNVRVFPESGTAGASTSTTLVRSYPSSSPLNGFVTVTNAGATTVQTRQIVAISADRLTLTVNPAWTTVGTWTAPEAGDSYAINDWTDGNALFQCSHLPALAEVTLELTDQRATRSFFFTQRFYIPASERSE
jgi:prepilin-type N-terminal cleavage/methylation domain-containing protein